MGGSTGGGDEDRPRSQSWRRAAHLRPSSLAASGDVAATAVVVLLFVRPSAALHGSVTGPLPAGPWGARRLDTPVWQCAGVPAGLSSREAPVRPSCSGRAGWRVCTVPPQGEVTRPPWEGVAVEGRGTMDRAQVQCHPAGCRHASRDPGGAPCRGDKLRCFSRVWPGEGPCWAVP